MYVACSLQFLLVAHTAILECSSLCRFDRLCRQRSVSRTDTVIYIYDTANTMPRLYDLWSTVGSRLQSRSGLGTTCCDAAL